MSRACRLWAMTLSLKGLSKLARRFAGPVHEALHSHNIVGKTQHQDRANRLPNLGSSTKTTCLRGLQGADKHGSGRYEISGKAWEPAALKITKQHPPPNLQHTVLPSGTVENGESAAQPQGQMDSESTPTQTTESSPISPAQTRVSTGFTGLVKEGQTLESPRTPGASVKTAVSDHKFAFTPAQLSNLVSTNKSLPGFYELGGLHALEVGLRTDRHCGLSLGETLLDDVEFSRGPDQELILRHTNTRGSKGESLSLGTRTRVATAWIPSAKPHEEAFVDRKRVFLDNTLPTKKLLSLLQLMWMAYNDFVLFFLTAAAAISLAVGFYQDFGMARTPGNPPIEWVEGVAILVAIVIIVTVGAVNDWEKERQFATLNQKQQDRNVKVIRSGESRELPIAEVLVGDVVHLESGDVIPADGIFIEGYNVRCDESSSTGEPILLHKDPAEEVFRALAIQGREKEPEQAEADTPKAELDPFIFSGSKVAEGLGTFLVTATGINSCHGKILMALEEEPGQTPLQVRLTKLAKAIAWFGFVAAVLLFVLLLIKFLAQLPHNSQLPAQKGQDFLKILIISLTVLVIAVPEGLPLAVTLALAFASNRMLKDNNLIRQLKACEIMGNVTSICSDKTGTLTQNKMQVVSGTIGTTRLFNDDLGVSESAVDLKAASPQDIRAASAAVTVPVGKFIGDDLIPEIKEMLKQSIVANSTAFEGPSEDGHDFIGSQTETALLRFARDHLAIGSLTTERANIKVIQLVPFDTKRQCMCTVVRLGDMYRLYVKGASEVLLRKCTSSVQFSIEKGVWTTELTAENTELLNHTITSYASHSLRTISLVYREFGNWPPPGAKTTADGEVIIEDILHELVFFCLVGIRDPLREGAEEAVKACRKAGATVRMVTGDNILTATAIAKECGILSASATSTNEDITMEGQQFRALSEEDMKKIIPNLKVLARSSPDDKRILVTRLKEMGEIVAVTGDGTNDAPALAAADIGLSMGISGTEIAREASAIVLMDDNFSSIVKAIMWGRAVNEAVKKFLQVCISFFKISHATKLTPMSSSRSQSASPP